MPTPASTQTNDVAAVVQLLLNAPQVSKYFHFTERPERRPLKIAADMPLAAGLTAGGEKVVVVDEHDRQALALAHIDVSGDKADLQFRYSPEGLMGHASFSRVGGTWTIADIQVGETG